MRKSCRRPLMKQNGKVDILPAIKKGEDSYEAWFGFNQSTFGGFLFHRSALLRRISAGFTSGLGLATKERYTKTCALYPRSQERSLTAHLVNTARRGLFTRWAVKPRRFLAEDRRPLFLFLPNCSMFLCPNDLWAGSPKVKPLRGPLK